MDQKETKAKTFKESHVVYQGQKRVIGSNACKGWGGQVNRGGWPRERPWEDVRSGQTGEYITSKGASLSLG
jgi:hypothetical protein